MNWLPIHFNGKIYGKAGMPIQSVGTYIYIIFTGICTLKYDTAHKK